MTKDQIVTGFQHLDQKERREVLRELLKIEGEVGLLEECDRLADERFQMLDAMEETDGTTSTR